MFLKRNLTFLLLSLTAIFYSGCFSSKDDNTTMNETLNYTLNQEIPSSKGVFAVNGDNTKVATANKYGKVILYDKSSKKWLTESEDRENDDVNVIKFSFDNKKIVTGGIDQRVKVWNVDTTTPAILQSMKVGGEVSDIIVLKDGKSAIIANSTSEIKSYDIEKGIQINSFNGHTDKVNSLDFSSDETKFVSASDDMTAKVWTTTSTGGALMTLTGHSGAVKDAVFNPSDSQEVMTVSSDKSLKIWDLKTNTVKVEKKDFADEVVKCAFSIDGTKVAAALKNNKIIVLNKSDLSIVKEFDDCMSTVNTMVFSDTSDLMVGADDGMIRNYNTTTLTKDSVIGGAFTQAYSIAYAGNNEVVAGYYDGTVRIWNILTGECISYVKVSDSKIYGVDYNAAAGLISSASEDGSVKLWSYPDLKLQKTLAGNEKQVRSAVFSKDGTKIVSAGWDRKARLYDVATGTLLRTFAEHTDILYYASFNSDGTKVITAGWDRNVKIWSINSDTSIGTYKIHDSQINSAVFTPDDKLIVTAGMDGTSRVYDYTEEKDMYNFKKHDSSVTSAFTNSAGTRVITAGNDKAIKIWDMASGEGIKSFTDFDYKVYNAQFSPSGSRVAACFEDGSIRSWDEK